MRIIMGKSVLTVCVVVLLIIPASSAMCDTGSSLGAKRLVPLFPVRGVRGFITTPTLTPTNGWSCAIIGITEMRDNPHAWIGAGWDPNSGAFRLFAECHDASPTLWTYTDPNRPTLTPKSSIYYKIDWYAGTYYFYCDATPEWPDPFWSVSNATWGNGEYVALGHVDSSTISPYLVPMVGAVPVPPDTTQQPVTFSSLQNRIHGSLTWSEYGDGGKWNEYNDTQWYTSGFYNGTLTIHDQVP